jgi:AP-3 complex subunit mu
MTSYTAFIFLVDPLLVFEMIHRIIDILVDYLGDVSEVSIRDNFVIVYQVSYNILLTLVVIFAITLLTSHLKLLEEMMDYGYPLTTEPNALKQIILPPTIMNKVMNTVVAASG